MHHLKNGGPNPLKMPPHQLINRILPTVVAEEFNELFVGRVDHFGDCLFMRVLNPTTLAVRLKNVCHWLCQCFLKSAKPSISALAKPVAHDNSDGHPFFNGLVRPSGQTNPGGKPAGVPSFTRQDTHLFSIKALASS
jgi:hypothetical protein